MTPTNIIFHQFGLFRKNSGSAFRLLAQPARYASLLLVLIGQVACTPLFVSDFEADTVGSGPLYDVPGNPAGDTVTGNVGSGSIVVHAYEPIEGTQSLKLFGPVLDGEGPVVLFNAAPNLNQTRPTYIIWQGMLFNDTAVDTDVLAYDETLLRIRFDNGSIYVNSVRQGSYTPNTIHTVLVGLFPTTDTYSIAMSGGAEIGGSLQGYLENPSEFPHPHISLMVNLLEGGYSDYYTVDTVTISRLDGFGTQKSDVRGIRMPKKYQKLFADIGADMLQAPDAPQKVQETLKLLNKSGELSLQRELDQIIRDRTLSREDTEWLEKLLAPVNNPTKKQASVR